MVTNCVVVIEDHGVSSSSSSAMPGSENLILKKIENRRNNKPIMEKRRRARINNCLNELKSLILETTKRDPSRHSKLEKADILEMTVKYLQDKKKDEHLVSNGLSGPENFKAGFSFCANAIAKYSGLDLHSKRKLLHQISNDWNQQSFVLNNNKISVESNTNQILLTNVAFLVPTSCSPTPQDLPTSQNLPHSSQPFFPAILSIPQRTCSSSSSSDDSRANTPESDEDSIRPISLVMKKRVDEEVSNVWRPF